MRLFVQPPARRPTMVEPGEALILLGDNWNDYAFRTLYSLYLVQNGRLHELGTVRVLKLGQLTGPPPLSTGEVPGGRLGSDFGSLGTSLDYYGAIVGRGRAWSEEVLSHLNDVVTNPAAMNLLREEPGFSRSLIRDLSDPEAYFEEIRAVLLAGGVPPAQSSFEFAYRATADAPPINFRFKPPPNSAQSWSDIGPSRRVVVLVGPNGVGKTQLLAKLARLAYAPPAERLELVNDGLLEGPAFPSIVAISYSVFDTFDPPRLTGDNMTEVARQLREGAGQYVYCGVRDLAAQVAAQNTVNVLIKPSDLAVIFADRLLRVVERGRFDLLLDALAPLVRDEGFRRHLPEIVEVDNELPDIRDRRALSALLAGDVASTFNQLSSGHKIVMHLLTQLAASFQRRGLALVDEPETHLHPPLLAALMAGLRTILEQLSGYAIVATHSPVVAQETPAFQVLIMDTDGSVPYVREPQIETFGENVGALTREIFGLHTDATDFRSILDDMVDALGNVELIERALGASLSSPALGHVMARLARKGQ
jgi:hypothetical protein